MHLETEASGHLSRPGPPILQLNAKQGPDAKAKRCCDFTSSDCPLVAVPASQTRTILHARQMGFEEQACSEVTCGLGKFLLVILPPVTATSPISEEAETQARAGGVHARVMQASCISTTAHAGENIRSHLKRKARATGNFANVFRRNCWLLARMHACTLLFFGHRLSHNLCP